LLKISSKNFSFFRFNYIKQSFNPIFYPKNDQDGYFSSIFAHENEDDMLILNFLIETHYYTEILDFSTGSRLAKKNPYRNISTQPFFWNYDEYFLYDLASPARYDDVSDDNMLDTYGSPVRENVLTTSFDEGLDFSSIFEENIAKQSNFYTNRFILLLEASLQFLNYFKNSVFIKLKLIFINFFSIFIFLDNYKERKWLNLYSQFGYIVYFIRSVFSFSFFFLILTYFFFVLPYWIFYTFPVLNYFFQFLFLSFSCFIIIFSLAYFFFRNFRLFFKNLDGNELQAFIFSAVILWFHNVYSGNFSEPYPT
jgi:hypothetical protein